MVHGEHYLLGIPIRPLTFFQGCPIAATADHVATMSHDFSQSPAALVPMKVILKNRMLESPVKFSFKWEQPTTVSSSSFELIGTCEQKLELDASEEITIPFELLLPKAGVHNLQALRFVVHHENKEDVTYHLSQQWLLHLIDDSSSLSTETTP